MTTGFRLPFHVRSTIRYATGLEHVLLLLSTPVDDVTSLFTFVVWRNDDFAVSAEEVIRFDLAIGAEDKRMLELVPRSAAARPDDAGQRAGRPLLGRVAPTLAASPPALPTVAQSSSERRAIAVRGAGVTDERTHQNWSDGLTMCQSLPRCSPGPTPRRHG